jgi:hypothetical protein
MTMQKFCKREQNHQVYLNVLPSAAEFYAKVIVKFYSYKQIAVALLAKVLFAMLHIIIYTRAHA